ncbi:protein phosphatase 2C domain-containing protein [Microbacterium sp. NPDC019599]|uniref:PP2C family protein-serine/threonine phosphatase n=1 Tax=Microbacterium sp. NPDC019599 TaxID=3154690 RepID=UPI003407D351
MSPLHDVNQDGAFATRYGAAVADGVGGGPAGDIASSVLVRLVASGSSTPLELDEVALLLARANAELRGRILADPACDGMATTFTGLFAGVSGGVLLAHAGDSRAYLLRDGMLSRQTRDDSFVQLLVESGVVLPDDAASHPQRNVITASLRGAEHDVVAFTEVDAALGDRWLLCSDGVTDYVPDDVLGALLAEGTAEAAAERIVRVAVEAGSRDDVTAVVCDVVADSEPWPEDVLTGSAAVDPQFDGLWDLESA